MLTFVERRIQKCELLDFGGNLRQRPRESLRFRGDVLLTQIHLCGEGLLALHELTEPLLLNALEVLDGLLNLGLRGGLLRVIDDLKI
jgi:hypothetical protein